MSNSPFSRRNIIMFGYILAITCYGLSIAYYAIGDPVGGARFLIPGSFLLLVSSLLRTLMLRQQKKEQQKQSSKSGKSTKKK